MQTFCFSNLNDSSSSSSSSSIDARSNQSWLDSLSIYYIPRWGVSLIFIFIFFGRFYYTFKTLDTLSWTIMDIMRFHPHQKNYARTYVHKKHHQSRMNENSYRTLKSYMLSLLKKRSKYLVQQIYIYIYTYIWYNQ